jgi:hypothetical protein
MKLAPADVSVRQPIQHQQGMGRRRKPQQQQRKHGLQRQARNNGAPWDAPRIIAVPPLTKRPGEKQQEKEAEDAAHGPSLVIRLTRVCYPTRHLPD